MIIEQTNVREITFIRFCLFRAADGRPARFHSDYRSDMRLKAGQHCSVSSSAQTAVMLRRNNEAVAYSGAVHFSAFSMGNSGFRGQTA